MEGFSLSYAQIDWSRIQAAVCDLDGTLLDSTRGLSQRTLSALMRCKEANLPFLIATARPPRAVAALPLTLFHSAIYYNGALLVNHSTGQRIHTPIDTLIGMDIIQSAHQRHPEAIISVECDDSWFVLGNSAEEDLAHFGLRQQDIRPKSLSVVELTGYCPTKILISHASIDFRLLNTWRQRAHVVVTDNGQLIQIMAKNVSKESGLATLTRELQLELATVMVFGDDYNDMGLFESCGFPIAMGNAIDELKNIACLTTATNDEDGVALILERWLAETAKG